MGRGAVNGKRSGEFGARSSVICIPRSALIKVTGLRVVESFQDER